MPDFLTAILTGVVVALLERLVVAVARRMLLPAH
jgi:hypothetical protein